MNAKLLCATDGSHSSEKAVDFAIDLACRCGGHLTFLTVNHLTGSDVAHTHFWDSAMLSAADAQLQSELRAAVCRARAAGLRDVSCAVCEGHDIAAAIISFAEAEGYGHVITGSVGRRGVARILLGSIAQEVTVRAHCPVTVVR